MDTGYQALGVFILTVFLLILLLSRPGKHKWNDLREYTQPLSRKIMLGVFLIASSILTFVCFILPAHTVSDPDEVLSYSEKEELHHQTFWACYMKLQKNRYDYRAHYLLNKANQAVQKSDGRYALREILPSYRVFNSVAYENMADTGKGRDRDLGFFGMAMLRYVYYDDVRQCREFLDSVKDKNVPFVNFLYAACVDSLQEKIRLLKKDLQISPAKEAATSLSAIYSYLGYPEEMGDLVYSANTGSLVPISAKLSYAFRHGHSIDFFIFSLERVSRGLTVMALAGSLLILALWLGFLVALDVMEKEKVRYVIITLLAGGLMAILCNYLYVGADYMLDYHENDSFGGDFLYFIFVVGGIEELVKIIPLLILIRFTKEVNEPMDYIFFAALSALGFSVIEDIFYFNTGTVGMIYSRAIFTSLGHIADSSIIAYFIVRARYRDGKNVWLSGLKGFALACVVHGIYDFFLANDVLQIKAVSFTILLVQCWWLVHAVNNCLNNSPFYSSLVRIDSSLLAVTVSGGLFALISFVFLDIAMFMNEEYAMMRYFYALLYYFYPLFFFNICIKKLDVFPGHWENLRWKKILTPSFFFAGINPKYYLLQGRNLVLTPHGRFTRQPGLFPLRARVVKREKVDDYTGWFTIELEKPVRSGMTYSNVFLMRASKEDAPYTPQSRNESMLYLVKPGADIRQLKKENLLLFDKVSVQVLDA